MTHLVSPPATTHSLTDTDTVLVVQGISKKFCRSLKHSLFYGTLDIAAEITGQQAQQKQLRPQEFWALQGVSFELKRGQALGLIGKNGSGKTTMLRIIAGLIKPNSGWVTFKGRIAPLIALGSGLNPILTGRENIYINMSILGLGKKQIDERFDEVVEFSELEASIDAPVQSYSSGMAARLGFASAIYTDPDILLIDEVLAVGDIRFRQKCRCKLYDLRQKGTAFILVSHNPQAILNICKSSIYLSQGHLVCAGQTDSVMHRYEQDLFLGGSEKVKGIQFLPEKPAHESLGLDITYLLFRDQNGTILDTPITGEPPEFCIGYRTNQTIENAGIILFIQEAASENDLVLLLSSFDDHQTLYITPGEQEAKVIFPYLSLRPGLYIMRITFRKDSLYIFDLVDMFRFTVVSKRSMSKSLFYQPRDWQISCSPDLRQQALSYQSQSV